MPRREGRSRFVGDRKRLAIVALGTFEGGADLRRALAKNTILPFITAIIGFIGTLVLAATKLGLTAKKIAVRLRSEGRPPQSLRKCIPPAKRPQDFAHHPLNTMRVNRVGKDTR